MLRDYEIVLKSNLMGRYCILKTWDCSGKLLKMVTSKSFEVNTTSNCSEALEILGINEIDLIITENVLEDITGLEFIENIRQTLSFFLLLQISWKCGKNSFPLE